MSITLRRSFFIGLWDKKCVVWREIFSIKAVTRSRFQNVDVKSSTFYSTASNHILVAYSTQLLSDDWSFCNTVVGDLENYHAPMFQLVHFISRCLTIIKQIEVYQNLKNRGITKRESVEVCLILQRSCHNICCSSESPELDNHVDRKKLARNYLFSGLDNNLMM